VSSSPSAYPILRNARLYLPERLESRPGQVAAFTLTGAALAHSIRRIISSAASTLIIGADTKLYGANLATPLDTGYSGNPLSMAPIQPSQSPTAWMYVADSKRLSKVSADGLTRYNWGIAPPLNPPTIELGVPALNIIDDFSSTSGWTPGGTAGSLSEVSRYSSSVLAWLYDNGTSGWASVVPQTITNALQAGMLMKATQGSTTEEEAVQSVVPNAIPSGAAATIASIIYDSGTTGMCSLVLSISPIVTFDYPAISSDISTPRPQVQPVYNPPGGVPGPIPTPVVATAAANNGAVGIQQDTVLLLNGFEYVHVLAVATSQNGAVSIRCSTTSPHAAGESVSGVVSFRAYWNNTFGTSSTLAATEVESTVGAGTGTISKVAAYDLGIFGSANLSVQPTDWIHLSVQVDNAANIANIQILFDVDPSINDFAHTYYYYSFAPSSVQAGVSGQSSLAAAEAAAVSQALVISSIKGNVKISGPVPKKYNPQGQLNLGGSGTWFELLFQVSDLTLVGSSTSATLSSVGGIRVQITTTASAVCAVSSLWIAGGYGPDSSQTGVAYLYRYRGRTVKAGGARSYPSPATRQGLSPVNQSIAVTLPYHPDPQVDTLDVYRWGGSLAQWTYVSSIPNPSSGNANFLDIYPDSAISSNPIVETDQFQPFPTIDNPKQGTVNVTGTTVQWVSGNQFNPAWFQGTQININGVYYTLYQQPQSATTLQLVENAGTQTNAPFTIAEATLAAQPLPAFWGPYAQGTALVCFACGDQYQPGVLFLTNGNNPDAASDIYQIYITSPSDPLIGGCMYGGQSYVWSANRMFSLYPTFGNQFVLSGGELIPSEGTNLFVPIEVPNGKGLWCIWAIAVGPRMWFLARDGIYETTGGEPKSITAGLWSTLFPHDGQPGVAVTCGNVTINPPDMTQAAKLRLNYYDSFLYFDYQDTSGNPATLVYDTVSGTWSSDLYTVPVLTHYGDEAQNVHALWLGANNGVVYQASGSQDSGNNYPFAAYMPQMSEQQGGFQHVRDGYLGLVLSGTATLDVNVDGKDNNVTLAKTNGYQRVYTPLPPLKGRLWQFSLSGYGAMKLFFRDAEFRMKTWAEPKYRPMNPFSSFLRATQKKGIG